MPSRLTKDSKLSAGKNDIQPIVGRWPNWNLYDFKLDSGYKPKNSEVNLSENPTDDESKGSSNKKRWFRTFISKIKKS